MFSSKSEKSYVTERFSNSESNLARFRAPMFKGGFIVSGAEVNLA